MRNGYLRIKYEVGKDLSEEEADAEAALARTEHIGALFTLLMLVDIESRWSDEGVVSARLEALSDALNGLGEMGMKISDGLYGNVCELYDAHKKTCENLEAVSTILDDAESQPTEKKGGAR